MPESKSKIAGLLIFVLLVFVLIYLIVYTSGRNKDSKMKTIEVIGNTLLSQYDYLEFTKLDDQSNFTGLSLPVIKARFEKHPYIKQADVEFSGKHDVKVYLTEKKILAVLLGGKDPYLISENYEVLPLLLNTKLDYPVISNCIGIKDIKPLKIIKSEDMKDAFKIIDAARLCDKNLFKSLSEIDLRNGGDIVLTFSGLKSPVIFGKGNAAKKIVYLYELWHSSLEGKNIIDNSSYIDLRFANEIYLGSLEKTGLTE